MSRHRHRRGDRRLDRGRWTGARDVELYRSALVAHPRRPGRGHRPRRLALPSPPRTTTSTRAGAAATAGLARWAGGDLEAAHRSYSHRASTGCAGPGTSPTCWAAPSPWPTSASPKAGSRDALQTYDDALRLADDDPLPVTRGTADMHVGISGVAYERNDLATAASTCS